MIFCALIPTCSQPPLSSIFPSSPPHEESLLLHFTDRSFGIAPCFAWDFNVIIATHLLDVRGHVFSRLSSGVFKGGQAESRNFSQPPAALPLEEGPVKTWLATAASSQPKCFIYTWKTVGLAPRQERTVTRTVEWGYSCAQLVN